MIRKMKPPNKKILLVKPYTKRTTNKQAGKLVKSEYPKV